MGAPERERVMTALKLVTAPVVEPVSLLRAKLDWRVTVPDEDSEILTKLVAARTHVEGFTGRCLITQTWDYFLDGFPITEWCTGNEIQIPNAPLQSVISVKYVDDLGVEQTMNTADYLVDVKSEPGRISPAYGKTWPSARRQMNAVTIRFVCGYGLAASVPEDINAGILVLGAEMFKHRELTVAGAVQELPTFEALLSPYRVIRF
jgi:uncharacterized phiE125 gp8 family phage protein